MRNLSITASPAPRQARNTSQGSQNGKESDIKMRVPFPSRTTEDNGRMFDLFETKAEVQILNSAEDDRLAASMYGGIKKKKKKPKKQKKGISGYNFDAMIKDESSSSSTSDYFH